MDKVVKKYNLKEHSFIKEEPAYWLSKTPAERTAAVDSIYNNNSCLFSSAVTRNLD